MTDAVDFTSPGASPAAAAPAPAERGIPGIYATRKKTNVKKVWVLLIVVIALIILAGAVASVVKQFDERRRQKHEAELKAATTSTSTQGVAHDFAADKAKAERDAALLPPPSGAMAAASTPAAQPVVVAPVSNGPTGAVAGQGAGRAAAPVDDRFAGDVLVGAKSRLDGAGSSAGGDATGAGRAGGSDLENKLTPSRLQAVRAGRLPDLTYLLKRGTTIPCAMRTRIVTAYPGMTSCLVTKDVYSADGKTLLIRAGSEATGEQRTALLQGQARIFVLWSRVDLPDGNFVELDSPGTDALGASGQEAYVDTHFWDRFGGAILLSIIGDAGQMLNNATQKSGSTSISVSNTTSATQSVIAETLRNTINIPPTGYSNQGAQINIFVARDADFRSVYELADQ